MFKMRYIFVTTLVFYIFLMVTPAVAAPLSNPAANPLCWLKDTCEKGQGEDKSEFCNNDKKCPDEAKQCPGEWGFCYPSPAMSKTKLQVPIGGYTTIANASQYIRTIYQVSLGIAVTAAIVVLMIAGFRYMTAAGNTSIIGQARTMILSAIIGLALLFGASLLFQTINPDIVKLTLPRFPKLRPQSLAQTTWCDQLFQAPDETKQFAYAGETPNIKKPDEMKAGDFKEKTKIGFLQEGCGKAWYPLDKPNTACYARKCEKNTQVCLSEADGGFGCKEVTLGGEINNAAVPVVTVTLWQVCNDGEVAPSIVSNIDYPDAVATLYTASAGNFAYYFNIKDELDPSVLCSVHGGEKGYMLAIELEEPGLNTTYALKRVGDACTIFSTKDDIYDLDEDLAGTSPSIFFQRDHLKTSTGLRCDINASK